MRIALALIVGVAFISTIAPANAQFADPFGSYVDGHRQGTRDRPRAHRPLTVTPEQRVVGQYLIAHALDVVQCQGPEASDRETRLIERRYGFAKGQRFHEATFAEYRKFRSQLRRGALTCQTVRQARQRTRAALRAFVPEVARADGAPSLAGTPQNVSPSGGVAEPLHGVPPAPKNQTVDCNQCEEGNSTGSSAITRMAYCPTTGNSGSLIIAFNDAKRREYAYLEVPPSTWLALKGAPSKGRFVSLSVKPHFSVVSASKFCS